MDVEVAMNLARLRYIATPRQARRLVTVRAELTMGSRSCASHCGRTFPPSLKIALQLALPSKSDNREPPRQYGSARFGTGRENVSYTGRNGFLCRMDGRRPRGPGWFPTAGRLPTPSFDEQA